MFNKLFTRASGGLALLLSLSLVFLLACEGPTNTVTRVETEDKIVEVPEQRPDDPVGTPVVKPDSITDYASLEAALALTQRIADIKKYLNMENVSDAELAALYDLKTVIVTRDVAVHTGYAVNIPPGVTLQVAEGGRLVFETDSHLISDTGSKLQVLAGGPPPSARCSRVNFSKGRSSTTTGNSSSPKPIKSSPSTMTKVSLSFLKIPPCLGTST
jgi:hypothetical protein